ncbi:MAG: OmpH family outer membrane protein [Acidobacteria bacterium]|nr:OmpH family outer membrane protein [Acidobacteriota bacterium]
MLRRRIRVSNCVLGLLALTLVAGSLPALAQTKIGVIDVEKLVSESPKGKDARTEMEKLRDSKRVELEGRRQELLDLRKRIEDGRLSLAAEKLQELQEEMESKAVTLKRAEDDANREIQRKGEKLMSDIEQQILPLIQKVGKEQGFTVIMNKYQSGLLYADPAIDITQSVIDSMAAAGG